MEDGNRTGAEKKERSVGGKRKGKKKGIIGGAKGKLGTASRTTSMPSCSNR